MRLISTCGRKADEEKFSPGQLKVVGNAAWPAWRLNQQAAAQQHELSHHPRHIRRHLRWCQSPPQHTAHLDELGITIPVWVGWMEWGVRGMGEMVHRLIG